eukprot:279327-Pelagomonas_calceolata.AAC.3
MSHSVTVMQNGCQNRLCAREDWAEGFTATTHCMLSAHISPLKSWPLSRSSAHGDCDACPQTGPAACYCPSSTSLWASTVHLKSDQLLVPYFL